MPLVYSDDERHEILIGSLKQMARQMMDQHVLPLERSDDFQETLNDHDSKIGTFAGEDDLFFQQNGINGARDSLAAERKIEEIFKLKCLIRSQWI